MPKRLDEFLSKGKKYETLEDIDEFLGVYEDYRLEQETHYLRSNEKKVTWRKEHRVREDVKLEKSLVEQYLKSLLIEKPDMLNDAVYYAVVEIAGRMGDSGLIYPRLPVELLQARFDYGVHDYRPRTSAVASGEIRDIRNKMLQRAIYNVSKALEGEVPDKVLDAIKSKIEAKMSKIEKKMAAKISEKAVPDNLEGLMQSEIVQVCKKIYMDVLGVSPAEAAELTENDIEIRRDFEKIAGNYSLGFRKVY